MNRVFSILAALLVSAQLSAQSSPPLRIFREVTFSPYAPIRLGEPPAHNSPPGQPRGTDRIVLPRGFGGTDSITIHFGVGSRITALEFAYPDTTSYAHFVADYLQSLGRPASRVAVDSASGRVERIEWKDSLTAFTITRFSQRSRTIRLSSLLSDRSAPSKRPYNER